MEEHGAEDCVLDVEEEGHGSDGGGSELASSVDTLLDNTYFDDEDLNEEQTCKRCVTIFTKYKGRTDFFRPHKLIFCPYWTLILMCKGENVPYFIVFSLSNIGYMSG